MTAPTDATVEERHRRATAVALGWDVDSDEAQKWIKGDSIGGVAKAIANAERDGRASRDAEVAELRAYRRAWEVVLSRCVLAMVDDEDSDETVYLAEVLAEELARKGTP